VVKKNNKGKKPFVHFTSFAVKNEVATKETFRVFRSFRLPRDSFSDGGWSQNVLATQAWYLEFKT